MLEDDVDMIKNDKIESGPAEQLSLSYSRWGSDNLNFLFAMVDQ